MGKASRSSVISSSADNRHRQAPVAPAPPVKDETVAKRSAREREADYVGQRKLVRPVLPENAAAHRDAQRRSLRGMLVRQEWPRATPLPREASHAEEFYFQKQIQTQTQMVFVLEDGEQVEGYIEWYDRNCVKVRNNTRVLIYKSAIKYLYKASDRQGDAQMTMT